MSESADRAKELYTKLHQGSSSVFAGKNFLTSLNSIRALSIHKPCGRVLDFGCGKGWQYDLTEYKAAGVVYPTLAEAIAATEVVGYDPCVPKFATRPTGKFQGIIAVDVLNSIPLPDLANEVEQLFRQLSNTGWLFVRATLADSKKAINDPYWQEFGRTVADYLQVCAPPDENQSVVIELQTSHTGRQDWCTWYWNYAEQDWTFSLGTYA